MVRVLFVCLGNICRSPMAEAVFAHKVKAAGLEDVIEADSAGTGDWHVGERPHRGTRALLKERKIDYAHAARLVTLRDLNTFDYVLTMDSQNLANVRALGTGRAVVAAVSRLRAASAAARSSRPVLHRRLCRDVCAGGRGGRRPAGGDPGGASGVKKKTRG